MSPQGHLVSLTRTFMHWAKQGDLKNFYGYIESDAFIVAFMGVAPNRRKSVLTAYAKAQALCEKLSRRPLIKPRAAMGNPTGKSKWTSPAMRAKLSNAYAKGKTDEGAARLLGVTVGSARLAKRRYLDAAATQQFALAA